MVEYSGFTFAVETEGGPLPEHAFPDEEPTATTKSVYLEIPTTDEPQPFKIRITPVKPIDYATTIGFSFNLKVDGVQNAYSQWMTAERNPEEILINGLYINTPDRAGAIQKEMLFGRIRTTEEGDNEAGNTQNVQVGLISIEIRKIESIGPAVNTFPLRPEQSALHEGVISEKRLKGSSSTHQTKLGKDMSGIVGPFRVTYKYSPLLGTVRILYRNKASLQSLGVIPQDPPTPRLKREREEVIDLTGGDERSGIKREPGIKQERETRRKRFQVVDLTI